MCLSSTFGLTQDSQRSEGHSKVGLVLEGGGALGLAHIGVIQYLEEHHIPVRYIAGTSMGGLVGAGRTEVATAIFGLDPRATEMPQNFAT